MGDRKTSRKLAVLLHADVVGSTALVRLNETLAHERIHDAFLRLSETIALHGGIAHEIRGDALVAEFARASDAVSAAMAFQTANSLCNDELVDEIRPEIRIGIAMGEVVIAGSTITGEGVILAQRLEQLAERRGICIQGAAYETIPKRLPFDYENLGEHRVKGFDEPVRVYKVSLKPGESIPVPEELSKPAKAAPEKREKPAIAVLPFANIGGDPEQEYFSDGITEDIIAALSHFRSFPVIARNSTFTYKGRIIRVQQVAEELGARYVLEGGVRKAGDRLRITAQLVDAETGHHVWADKFDRTMEDVFEIQDEITQKIAATIQPELAHAELEKSAVKRPENLTAWDYMLRGMAHMNWHTRDGFSEARKILQRAIDIDPDYTDAWAGLAFSYLGDIMLCGTDERQELVEKGMEAAKRAVALDDHSSFAHYVLGMAYVWSEQFQVGISEVEVSLQLNPYNAQAQMGLGNRLDLIGRASEGIAKMEQGLKLSPRDPTCPMFMAFLCRAYLGLNQPVEAFEWIERAVHLRPDNPDLQYRHAICLANLDRVDEAKKALDECERLEPGFLARRERWRPYSDDERNQRFFAGLSKHGLPPVGSHSDG